LKSLSLAALFLIASLALIECTDAADKKAPASAATKTSETPASTSKSPDKPETSSKKPPEKHAIHNFLTVCDGIYSGGQPDSEASFAELEKLGIKTIVSVDGAKPDVAAAKRHGMQYVHIPFGYDGIPGNAELSIVKVTKERPGPVFYHCHHGKHRGPAAAAVAGMCAGKMDVRQAYAYLDKAGTGPEYKGLWRDVRRFESPKPGTELPQLVETAPVPTLAAAMADIDRLYDLVKLCGDAGWKTPAGHPDVEPAHQALLLKEGFREAGRQLDDTKRILIGSQLSAAESLSESIENSVKANKLDEATAAFGKLTAACKACHAKNRN
jgi:protein tyrosine phosphatase (PTP) superfamily phosphohydrolase (DUF442 family)